MCQNGCAFLKKHLLLVGRLERCCSSFRSFSQGSLTREDRPCNVYLRREPLCSCHNPQDLSSPPTVSFISTSFSWTGCRSERGECVNSDLALNVFFSLCCFSRSANLTFILFLNVNVSQFTLASLFSLHSTIHSLKRKTCLWCPLEVVLTSGVSSQTVKTP